MIPWNDIVWAASHMIAACLTVIIIMALSIGFGVVIGELLFRLSSRMKEKK